MVRWTSLAAGALLLALALALAAPHAAAAHDGDNDAPPVKTRTPPKDLRIGVLHRPETCDYKIQRGDKVEIHYTGTFFEDNKQFVSSYDKNKPIEFTVGVNQIIQGWDRGVLGMCVGEKRRLVIPPSLAYGSKGDPPRVPGDATLVYVIELTRIVRRKVLPTTA